ncbi:competence protein CoiA family protein [Hahella sp. CR1]|uniref:competence protein CoiA family protein n=1 Tax=Hahella sp. CR1 TaxID=2992807 RepID=UPI0024427A63|nr:competence protein CoiA family protein [Hahella sp. CR1]MDG9672089.1 competence protein CoiA family protein [Hahella sp. CR1]
MKRIPFGLQVNSSKLVDVHEVPRGIHSGCICPSCRIELVARQGQKKTWHFAHFTKNKSEEEITQCEYSFYVSVAMMARQLMDSVDACNIQLPLYERLVSVNGMSEWITITESREVTLKDIFVSQQMYGVDFDVLGKVQGKKKMVPLGLQFEYPERRIDLIQVPVEKPIGILAVDLTGLESLFWEEKDHSNTFKHVLKTFLLDKLEGKRWLFHPNQNSEIRAAEKELQKKSPRNPLFSQVAYHNRTHTPYSTTRNAQQRTFTCAQCGHNYNFSASYGSRCPRCVQEVEEAGCRPR